MNNNFLNSILDWVHNNITLGSDLLIKFVLSIFFLVIIWITRIVVIKIVWKRSEEISVRYKWKKTSGYVAAGLIILLLGVTWIKGFESIATFLGILSAGLIFILRDPVANFTGWIFIISRRHLEVGDRIEIDGTAGDVIDINIFYFTVMEIGNWVKADQSTGRIMHIPNSFVLNKTVANYTKGLEFLWNEIPVVITFESNWVKAKNILENIVGEFAQNNSKLAAQKAKEAARRFYINYTIFTPIVYTDVIEYGVTLTVRYLCEPRKRRDSEAELWENILKEFEKCNDIDFAYPTQRFYDNKVEGKKIKKQRSSKNTKQN